jgi:hypothetical protein
MPAFIISTSEVIHYSSWPDNYTRDNTLPLLLIGNQIHDVTYIVFVVDGHS